jgi:hypothetical protein
MREKQYYFHLEISKSKMISFFILLGTLFFFILWDNNLLPMQEFNDLEGFFQFITFYIFGYAILNLSILVYVLLFLSLIRSIIGFFEGLMGIIFKFLFALMFYALICIPFGKIRFSFLFGSFHLTIFIGIGLSILIILFYRSLIFIFEISFYLTEEQISEIQQIRDSGEIGEIKVIPNKKKHINVFKLQDMHKLNSDMIYSKGKFTEIQIEKQKMPIPKFKSEKRKDNTEFIFLT